MQPAREENEGPRPTRYAAAIVGGYALLGGTYIVLSSLGVGEVADDVASAQRVEVAKGLGFIAVTGALLFAASRAALTRADRDARALAAHREAVLLAEQRSQAGLLASTIAHDLNNVFTVLGTSVRALGDDGRSEGEREEIVRDLRDATAQGADLVRRMRSASLAPEEGERVEAELGEIAREAVDMIRNHASLADVTVTTQAVSQAPARVHIPLFRQLLANLVINAGEATGGGGAIVVVTSGAGQTGRTGGGRAGDDGGEAVLEVHDDGPGVAPESREHLFEAFATSKPNGTGLGLISCKLVAEAHGGTVEASSSPRGGACFRVRLPIAR